MILKMTKVRFMGPRAVLKECLDALQDAGCVQLANVSTAIGQAAPVHAPQRRVRQVTTILARIESLLADLGAAAPPPRRTTIAQEQVLRWAQLSARLQRRVRRVKDELQALSEERALILKYVPFLKVFAKSLTAAAHAPDVAAYHLLLRPDQTKQLPQLERALSVLLHNGYEISTTLRTDRSLGVLLLVSMQHSADVQRVLAEAHIQEIRLPAGFESAANPLHEMNVRLRGILERSQALRAQLVNLCTVYGGELLLACATLHDWLAAEDAVALARDTGNAFVLEGWTPTRRLRALYKTVQSRFAGAVLIEVIERDQWRGNDVPVVLENPRMLRPFELLVSALPLPRYGSIDPTPFVAVFFPMMVGIMIGDVGYGLLLGALAILLRFRTRRTSVLRTIGEIAGACALFTILFGFAFGEFLGDLGRRLFQLRPLLLNREDALLPLLYISLGLGLVHILLGLVIGVINAARREPRLAVGRSVTILMLLLILVTLLSIVDVLPRSFFTPGVVGLLVCFPLLVAAEGIIGAVELFSTIGNVLSYARVMALGVASVILAIVANRMSGALGSVIVGVIFALLFHVVNFALALFGPTIHGLRLHYVEFFKQFYSPGGSRFEPFEHWHTPSPPTKKEARWSSSGSHSVPHLQSASPR